MGVYSNKKQSLTDTTLDELYVIYGPSGSGKTTLFSTFPKSEENKQMIIDILEAGDSVYEEEDHPLVEKIFIDNVPDLENLLEDVLNGADRDTGEKIAPGSIGVDSITNLEFMLKIHLKDTEGKATMNKNLWGRALDEQEMVAFMLKKLAQKLQIPIVAIAQDKMVSDEKHKEFGKIIPKMMFNAAVRLCSVASFVWYTDIEEKQVEKNGKMEREDVYMTTIDRHASLLTKTRKPRSFEIPQKIQDLTYPRFKTNVLDKIGKGNK